MKRKIMALSLSLAMALTSANAVFADVQIKDENGTVIGTELPFSYSQGSEGDGEFEGGVPADSDITIVTLPTATLDFSMDPNGIGGAKTAMRELVGTTFADLKDSGKLLDSTGAAAGTGASGDVYLFCGTFGGATEGVDKVTVAWDDLEVDAANGNKTKFKSEFKQQEVYDNLCKYYKGTVKGKSVLVFSNNGMNNVQIDITAQTVVKKGDKTVFLDAVTTVGDDTNKEDGTEKNLRNELKLNFNVDADQIQVDEENLINTPTGAATDIMDSTSTDTNFGKKGEVKYFKDSTTASAEAAADKAKQKQVVYAADSTGQVFDNDGALIQMTMAGDYSYGVPFDLNATKDEYKAGTTNLSTAAKAAVDAATDKATAKQNLVKTKATHTAFMITGEMNDDADWKDYIGTNATEAVGCKAVYTVTKLDPTPADVNGGTGNGTGFVQNLNGTTPGTDDYIAAGSIKSAAATKGAFTAAGTFGTADLVLTLTPGSVSKEKLSDAYLVIGGKDVTTLKSGTIWYNKSWGAFDTAAGTVTIKAAFLKGTDLGIDTASGKKFTVDVKDTNGKTWSVEVTCA